MNLQLGVRSVSQLRFWVRFKPQVLSRSIEYLNLPQTDVRAIGTKPVTSLSQQRRINLAVCIRNDGWGRVSEIQSIKDT